MNPYRVPSAAMMSRIERDAQIPPMPSKTPRLDYIEKHGWESFWNAVGNGVFDDKPTTAQRRNGLSTAPMGVFLA